MVRKPQQYGCCRCGKYFTMYNAPTCFRNLPTSEWQSHNNFPHKDSCESEYARTQRAEKEKKEEEQRQQREEEIRLREEEIRLQEEEKRRQEEEKRRQEEKKWRQEILGFGIVSRAKQFDLHLSNMSRDEFLSCIMDLRTDDAKLLPHLQYLQSLAEFSALPADY